MNDHLDLDQRLHQLAAAIRPPVVPPEDDVARGRSRLRRHRLLATGGTATGVAAVALAVAVAGNAFDGGGSAGPALAPTSQAPTSHAPTTHAPTPPDASDPPTIDGAQLLRQYRDVLAEHLDPGGTHLQRKPDNLQSGGGLGTKLGWTVPGQDGLGMVQVFVGKGWNGFIGADCGHGADCSERTVDGTTARVIAWNGATTVVVKRPATTVAITVDALFGNNSLVPLDGMDIAIDDLVRAAADERLVPATPEQIANAGEGLGFPDVGHRRTLEEGASENPVASSAS